jgi:hypothetical protein
MIGLGHSEFLGGHWTFSFFPMVALARHSPALGTTAAGRLKSRTECPMSINEMSNDQVPALYSSNSSGNPIIADG